MKQLSAILLLFSIVVGKMFGQENASLPTKDNQVFSNDRFFLKTRTTAQTVSTSLPLTMSYQGLLTTGLGAPVADGLYDLQFDLYDSLTGGTSQWTETQAGVPAQRGTFNVILGSINPLNLQFTQKLFVNVITTNGPAGPSYPLAFSPRSELTSVPYALAPWQSNNNSVYFNNGRVGIGTATPGTTGGDLQYVKFEIADQLGFTSDEVFRVAGGGYAGLNFATSRGTLETPQVVSANAPCGLVGFLAYDGSAYTTGAQITGYVDGIPAVGGTAGRLSFSTRPSGVGSLSERMVITGAGSVGIGMSAPTHKLQVYSNSGETVLGIQNASTGGHLWQLYSTGTGNGEGAGHFMLRDGLAGSVRMIVSGSTGYVGLGVSAPSNRITLPNTANVGGQGLANAWSTYSSKRWKTNIKTIEHAVDKVKGLRGVTYDWKSNGKHDIGLIAEEVGEVIPEVVTYEQNGKDAQSVDYARLVSLLIEAVKQQQKQIDELRGLTGFHASSRSKPEESN